MKSWLPLALLALPFAAPLRADPRVEHIEYRPDQVVRITGARTIQTMVTFAPDEHIENIALGDAAAWQVTPNRRGNLLFIKPLLVGPVTNMTVVTDQRRYLFELTNARPGARVRYAVQFTYAEPIRLIGTPPPVAPEPAAAPPPPPAPINTAWQARGDKQMIPARIYDDGTSTYIAWTATGDLPAVLVQGSDGVEGPVNFTARGDYLVVEGVARRYVLRIGKASAVLTNLAPPPAPRVPPVLIPGEAP
jgi:type IV secretion system protein VirB9